MSHRERAHLRQIPSVEKILTSREFVPLIERFGRGPVKDHLVRQLDGYRNSPEFAGFGMAVAAAAVKESLESATAPSLRRVINGSGILIHTNLGRAPVDPAVWRAGEEIATGYSNLEFDLAGGDRGRRDEHIAALAGQLFGCEAAILVNNNAGAVLLLLAAIAAKKDVLVSRGELVEIGGSFRIPDVIHQGGARLAEVGTTNRTRIRDYAEAITRRTAAILKVHRSNFRLVGFTESAPIEDLVRIGKVPVVVDEGSGCVVDLSAYGFARQATLRELIATGVAAVTCSTDKLIGSLQGGLILGTREVVERCARHPLMRALRVGKESYATLTATLQSFLSGKHEQQIPIYRMLATSLDELRSRARTYAGTRVVETQSALGGGTTPTETIASIGVVVPGQPNQVAERLRRSSVPIVGRVENDRFVLDLRTIFPEEDAIVIAAL